MVSVAMLIVTDGRDDYLAHCIASANVHLSGPVTERWLYDDTGDAAYRARLFERYPSMRHINGGRRQGFGGAIRAAWQQLAQHSGADWVFHLEQDFVFNRPVELAGLIEVMTRRPYLAQMALRRQSWNAEEEEAGGVIELHPEAYDEHRDTLGRAWLEHSLFWTTNPSLYRRSLCATGWPLGANSEGEYTRRLLSHGTPDAPPAEVRFGYWGAREDSPWVEHIGRDRVGHGY